MLIPASLSQLALQFWIFGTWQIVGVVLLIVLIIFWLQYRKRQM